MKRGMKKMFSAALVSGVVFGVGCTGLEPALLGAAVSGTQTGITLLADADVYRFDKAPFDATVGALDRAAEELGLEAHTRYEYEDRVLRYYRFRDDLLLEVEVRRETEAVTSIKASVNKHRNRGIAQLYIQEIRGDLSERGFIEGDGEMLRSTRSGDEGRVTMDTEA